jgi:hypothetical protein
MVQRGRVRTYSVSGVLSGSLLSDLDVLPGRSSAIGIDHASVGAAAISIDLVECHLNLAALRDLGKFGAGLGHDGLGAGLEVVGASADRLADCVGRVTLESGAVLLEGVAPRPVAGSGGINT